VFFLGDQVDPQVYNSTFFGRDRDGASKLLPLRLRDVEGSTDSYVNFVPAAPDHPVIRFLRGLNQIVFRTVAVQRYVRAEEPAPGEATVILRYSDEDSSPALAEKVHGEGRVLLFTTAADLEWSNFPHSMLYLALAQEIGRYVVRPDASDATLLVGSPIVIPYDPTRMGTRVVVAPPAESGAGPVGLTSRKEPDGRLLYRFERTDTAGVYEARLRSRDDQEIVEPFACNVDPTEGDLERARLERVRDAVPGSKIERAGDDGGAGDDAGDKSEFWRTLVYAMIAIAAAETLLAWRFGHHAKVGLEAEGKQVFVR
jgi:hypothetical protein